MRTRYPARTWLREARGDVTFREFADGTGFSTGHLSLLEQGISTPDLMSIPRLAVLYEVEPLEMCRRFMAEVAIEKVAR